MRHGVPPPVTYVVSNERTVHLTEMRRRSTLRGLGFTEGDYAITFDTTPVSSPTLEELLAQHLQDYHDRVGAAPSHVIIGDQIVQLAGLDLGMTLEEFVSGPDANPHLTTNPTTAGDEALARDLQYQEFDDTEGAVAQCRRNFFESSSPSPSSGSMSTAPSLPTAPETSTPPTLCLYVRAQGNWLGKFTVPGDATAQDVMNLIELKTNIPASCQRLQCGRYQLCPCASLRDAGVEDGSFINVFDGCLRGCAPMNCTFENEFYEFLDDDRPPWVHLLGGPPEVDQDDDVWMRHGPVTPRQDQGRNNGMIGDVADLSRSMHGLSVHRCNENFGSHRRETTVGMDIADDAPQWISNNGRAYEPEEEKDPENKQPPSSPASLLASSSSSSSDSSATSYSMMDETPVKLQHESQWKNGRTPGMDTPEDRMKRMTRMKANNGTAVNTGGPPRGPTTVAGKLLLSNIVDFQTENGLDATPDIQCLLGEYCANFEQYAKYSTKLLEFGFGDDDDNLEFRSSLEDIPIVGAKFLAALLYPPAKIHGKNSIDCETGRFMKRITGLESFLVVDYAPVIPLANKDVNQDAMKQASKEDDDELSRLYRERIRIVSEIMLAAKKNTDEKAVVVYVGGGTASTAFQSVIDKMNNERPDVFSRNTDAGRIYAVTGLHPTAGHMAGNDADPRVQHVLQLVAAVVAVGTQDRLGDWKSHMDDSTKALMKNSGNRSSRGPRRRRIRFFISTPSPPSS